MKKRRRAVFILIASVSILVLTGCKPGGNSQEDLKATMAKLTEEQKEENDKETADSKDEEESDTKESEKKDSEEKDSKTDAKTEDKKTDSKTDAKTEDKKTDSKPSTTQPSTSKTETPKTCSHNWKDNYQTVTVKEAWDEQVLVSAAWDETVVDVPERTEYTSYSKCHTCGYIPSSGDDADMHILNGLINNEAHGPWGTKTGTVTIPAVTHVEHHDAVYNTVHHDAVTKQQKVNTTCTKCGAVK